MADQHTVTTTTSWGQRIKGAIAGFFIGPVLIIGALILLWTNEGRSVTTANGLAQGAKIVTSIPSSPLDASHEGKLIHTTGIATTDEVLGDSVFGIEESGIVLSRIVEVYQWKENSTSNSTDKYGGSQSTTTNYTYEKVWSDEKIDSSAFYDAVTHTNPSQWQYESLTSYASDVRVGDIRLADTYISQIEPTLPVSLSGRTLLSGATLVGDVIYIARAPATPEIGDIRIRFVVARPVAVSVIGTLTQGILDTFTAKNGATIALLDIGTQSASVMFETAQKENTLLTWILRGLGLLLLVIGFSLIFQLLVILAKVIPPLATVIGWGSGFIAFLLALAVGGVTIALAWVWVRPVLSITILAIIVGVSVYMIQKKRKSLTPPVV